MAERRIAEVRLFVSGASGDDGEESYRVDVLAGSTVGPEDASLRREEFTGSSIDEVVDSALAWIRRALEGVAD